MQRILDLFSQDLSVINLGLEGFGDALTDQGVDVVQMDWRPPAGGDRDLMKILDQMEE